MAQMNAQDGFIDFTEPWGSHVLKVRVWDGPELRILAGVLSDDFRLEPVSLTQSELNSYFSRAQAAFAQAVGV